MVNNNPFAFLCNINIPTALTNTQNSFPYNYLLNSAKLVTYTAITTIDASTLCYTYAFNIECHNSDICGLRSTFTATAVTQFNRKIFPSVLPDTIVYP